MIVKNVPLAVSPSACPELLETVTEGFVNRFTPQHNGTLVCAGEGQWYDAGEVEFFEVNVAAQQISLFKVKAPDGTLGFILQKRNL